jgi:hypothetical protein
MSRVPEGRQTLAQHESAGYEDDEHPHCHPDPQDTVFRGLRRRDLLLPLDSRVPKGRQTLAQHESAGVRSSQKFIFSCMGGLQPAHLATFAR